MILLAITKHLDLVERLRTAFEGAGHRVDASPDHLQALASEAWNRAHAILVDGEGDPVDGFRFCHLLRGESRILFRHLPLFLILEAPPGDQERAAIDACGADGHLLATDGVHRCLAVLGPVMTGHGRQDEDARVPVLATGLRPDLARRASGLLAHYGFDVRRVAVDRAEEAQRDLKAPVILVGPEPSTSRCVELLEGLHAFRPRPYTLLLGRRPNEADERRLLLTGLMDWLPLPLSPPRLLHAVRKAMEWNHIRRVQEEYHFQLNDLVERRALLEMEAAALRNEVLTDPLTELLNRRAFDQNLEHALSQWARHRRPFTLVLGDLDYFKLINDRFGHLSGDQVLRAVAQRLKGALRRSDLAFRIGGEEFAAILPETGVQAAFEVADKIRRRIDEQPVTLEGGPLVFPTMSFGVGAPSSPDVNALILKVDEALYLAKHKGRNRIELAL